MDSNNSELTAGVCINNNILLGLIATIQISFFVVKWIILRIHFFLPVLYILNTTLKALLEYRKQKCSFPVLNDVTRSFSWNTASFIAYRQFHEDCFIENRYSATRTNKIIILAVDMYVYDACSPA